MNERVDRFRVGDRWADLPVAGVFEVNADGKIVLWRDYFDLTTFTTQFASLSP
jgi:limonene-1,2-epoxide hydrolase